MLAAGALGLLFFATACAGGEGVSVNLDQTKPFVLGGVSALTEIARLTGPGAINDTVGVGVAGTDLGSMVNLDDTTYFLFGDTFGERDPDSIGGQGGNWRSNVVAWSTDADPTDGITFDGWAVDEFGLAAPIVEGDHDANDFGGEVTKIPTYGFAVDGSLYAFFMSVSHWGEPGAWDANYAALARSDDEGRSWHELAQPRWPGGSNTIQVATAHVDDPDGAQIYFWTIPAGRFGSVDLMRVADRREAVEDASAYQYYSGVGADGTPQWSGSAADAEHVVEGTIGELSVMFSTYLDRWVMTYSDAGNAYIREGITPWGSWGEPIELVSGKKFPGLYAPFLNPRYVTDGGRTIYFTLSLWGPYNVFWFSADLNRLATH